MEDFWGAVFGGVLHDYEHALDAGDEVHCAAHAFDHLAGDHPVGEVACSETCMAPRMARSMWPPRIMAKDSALEKKTGAGERGHDLFAGVDEVGVALVFGRIGPMPSSPFSRLQGDGDVGGDVVGDEGGDADAEIDVGCRRSARGRRVEPFVRVSMLVMAG